MWQALKRQWQRDLATLGFGPAPRPGQRTGALAGMVIVLVAVVVTVLVVTVSR